MNEEKMDEMIKRAAASYNAPPATVPREEMWSAIRAERAPRPRIVYGSAPRGTSALSRVSRRVWIGAAAAAALLVVAGIGLGRWSAPKAPSTSVASSVTKNPTIVSPSTAGNSTGLPDANASSSPAASSNQGGAPDFRASSPVRVARTGPRIGRTEDIGPHVLYSVPNQSRVRYGAPDRSAGSAYQLVTLMHLSDAEAMLTSFRSQTDEKMDAAMAKWARDLLTNTRLLLDSPAAADPRRRQLLEDLELTLVDIVQLSPSSGAQDRQMIEKNLDQGHVLTRLRTAIPAGMQKGS